jgi:hypothetical protein
MDLARLRFGDWVMGIGGLAVLLLMFLDWFETPAIVLGRDTGESVDAAGFNAWESFAVNDVILALAAVMALAAFVLTATQPTAAVPLALASLTTLAAMLALVLVVIRLIWPPELWTEGLFDVSRAAGAWLGLVATSALTLGVEPRLVQP